MTDLNYKLLDLIQSAVDLANFIRDDVQGDGVVSDETVNQLLHFVKIHDELNATLDMANFITKNKRSVQ
jgi:hypothetical protein